MYQWYRNADFCYVYLEDVSGLLATRSEERLQQLCHEKSQFRQSRWFKRGWTLQELLAPPIVHLFDRSWKFIGSRTELRGLIADITGIGRIFFDTGDLSQYSIAQKMSWASGRKTTRIEDQAYCLLGIFGITMPLLYGEGNAAFRRLQEEIVKRTDMDHSIFAHSFNNKGFLARQPSDFRNYGDVGFLDLKKLPQLHGRGKGATISSSGIKITLSTISTRPSSPRSNRTTKWAIVGNVIRKDVKDHDKSSLPEFVVVELIQEDPEVPGIYIGVSHSSMPEILPVTAEAQIQQETLLIRHSTIEHEKGWEQTRSRIPSLTLQLHEESREPGQFEQLASRLNVEYLDAPEHFVESDGYGSYLLSINPKIWQRQHLPVAFLFAFGPLAREQSLLVILTPTRKSANLLVFDQVRIVSEYGQMGSDRDLIYEASKKMLSISLRRPPDSTQPLAYKLLYGGRKEWIYRRFHLEVGIPHRGRDNTLPSGIVTEAVAVVNELSESGKKICVCVNAKRQPSKWHISMSTSFMSTNNNLCRTMSGKRFHLSLNRIISIGCIAYCSAGSFGPAESRPFSTGIERTKCHLHSYSFIGRPFPNGHRPLFRVRGTNKSVLVFAVPLQLIMKALST